MKLVMSAGKEIMRKHLPPRAGFIKFWPSPPKICLTMMIANILPSTLSVTTSFLAVYLTFRRNPFYAIAYAANDIVLIILWTLASLTDTRYISVVVCFAVFLFNDIYSFFCWQRMKKRQSVERFLSAN